MNCVPMIQQYGWRVNKHNFRVVIYKKLFGVQFLKFKNSQILIDTFGRLFHLLDKQFTKWLTP